MAAVARAAVSEPVLPDDHTQPMAQTSSRQLARFVDRDLDVQVAESGEVIKLPARAVRLIVELLTQLGDNKAVAVVPHHAEFTTQQAADFLGVSRPFVVKEINEQRLPAFKVGTHRRVRFCDLLDYQKRQHADREQALAELAAEAQEFGMGY